MKIGDFRINSKEVKDLPSKFKRFIQDQVFPMRIDIDLKLPNNDEKPLKEMCRIVNKKEE